MLCRACDFSSVIISDTIIVLTIIDKQVTSD